MIDSQSCHLALTGEQAVRVHTAAHQARFSIGKISLLAQESAAGIGRCARRAELVLERVIQDALDPHGACGGIVFDRARHRAAGVLVHFVDSAHVQCPAAVRLDLFDEIPIAVIDELRGLPAHGHCDQAILGVEGLGVGLQIAFVDCH